MKLLLLLGSALSLSIASALQPRTVALGTHQVPVTLPNGHTLVAPYLYQQVHQADPTNAYPSTRGIFSNHTHTYLAFDLSAPEFAGKKCRFHFVLGPADGGTGFGNVWAIDGRVDEWTTWNNRPRRLGVDPVAEFDVDMVDGVVGEGIDAAFATRETFWCPTGRIAWEVAPADVGVKVGKFGVNIGSWSWNKGLLVELVWNE